MILKCDGEFRGKSTKENEKGKYHFISIESYDEDGEAIKFSSVDLTEEMKDIKKGDNCIFYIDYNPTYKSLKVVGVEKIKNVQNK